MTTKFIGIKEFRQNMATYTKKAQKQQVRYIILKKNIPVLEVFPINEVDFAVEKLSRELNKAETEIKEGKFYSQEEIMKEFGLI
ncbi:type II toxin-antitoxin system Phd/YefM family antitoxin [Candidatus Peregrinibacteria bacterium]|nr:type II toxin-antitoxin system Phd/YefM family antitoxin [Candidatus Peregrinibacteria bacterium]